MDSKWIEPHISLKHQYEKFQHPQRRIGMKEALGLEGIKLQGTHHRGIDDARNIAQIFLKHPRRWKQP